MSTQKLAPTVDAANSSDITVVAGTPINVGLFTAGGGSIGWGVTAPITRKNSSGTYTATNCVISNVDPNFVISGAGVYRVEKPETDEAIGVFID